MVHCRPEINHGVPERGSWRRGKSFTPFVPLCFHFASRVCRVTGPMTGRVGVWISRYCPSMKQRSDSIFKFSTMAIFVLFSFRLLPMVADRPGAAHLAKWVHVEILA